MTTAILLESEYEVINQPHNGLMKIDFSKLPVNLKVSDIEIARLKKYEELTIIDLNDRTGYEVVDIRRKEVKKIRTSLAKYAKQLRDPAKVYSDKVIAEERRITGELQEIETNLEEKQKVIDDEKERIRLEEEKKAAEKLFQRVALYSRYTVNEINLEYLKMLTDGEFDAVVADMKTAWEKAEEDKRIAAEAVRQQEEENKRLKRELAEARAKEPKRIVPDTCEQPAAAIPVITVIEAIEPVDLDFMTDDKANLEYLLDQLSAIHFPEFENAALKQLVFDAAEHVNNAVQLIKKTVEENTL